ncbi:MAG: hypothetical protein ACR2IP_01710 [Solirubrobacteraceae bacterium]
MPTVGAAAVVQYLAARVGAVIQSVAGEGRELIVLTDDGETIEFVLRRSTGAFHAAGSGARLTLLS